MQAEEVKRVKELEDQYRGFTNRQLVLLNMAINERLERELIAVKKDQTESKVQLAINKTSIWFIVVVVPSIVAVVTSLVIKTIS